MMHYDMTVNDDCEIQLGGYQTSFVAHIFRLMLSKFPSIEGETRLMKHKPTNKLSCTLRPSAKKMRYPSTRASLARSE
jgi:hypothetical protein